MPVSSNAVSDRRIPTARYILVLVIALGGCALDLATKHYVFAWRGMPSAGPPRNVWWLWQPYIGIETALNPGALFGMFAGMRWVFIIASSIAIVGILYWAFGKAAAARDLLLAIPLAMILGGILGNLYDRLGLWHPPGRPDIVVHQVRDWILLEYPGLGTWPNFNIADSLLVCGVLVLLARTYCTPAPERATS